MDLQDVTSDRTEAAARRIAAWTGDDRAG